MDPTKQVFSLFEEFKKFAFKGNVIDLAVGVVIGGAFGKIVDSLVKHIIMPGISALMPSDQSYLTWKWILVEAAKDAEGKLIAGSGKEIPYGLFIGEVVNFFIVAAAVFLFVVKFLGWVMRTRKQEAAVPPSPPKPTPSEELLTEIRDLLKAKS